MNRLQKIEKNIRSIEYRYDDDLPMYDDLCYCLEIFRKIKKLSSYVLVDYVFDDDEDTYKRFLDIATLAGYEGK